MNIKNMLLTAGLVFSVVTTALPIGEEYKDLVYAAYELEQDFSQSPFIKENVDSLIYFFDMDIKRTEKQLQSMSSNKTTLVKIIGLGSGIAIARHRFLVGLSAIEAQAKKSREGIYGSAILMMSGILTHIIGIGSGVIAAYMALKAYDAFKSRKTLEESLALDKVILAKLIELRDAMALPIEADEYDQSIEI